LHCFAKAFMYLLKNQSRSDGMEKTITRGTRDLRTCAVSTETEYIVTVRQQGKVFIVSLNINDKHVSESEERKRM
jgi:hypothetical protein